MMVPIQKPLSDEEYKKIIDWYSNHPQKTVILSSEFMPVTITPNIYLNDPPLKCFIVFGYDHYYPSGGLSDVQGDYDTLEEALKAILDIQSKWDNVSIFDRQIGLEVDLDSEELKKYGPSIPDAS